VYATLASWICRAQEGVRSDTRRLVPVTSVRLADEAVGELSPLIVERITHLVHFSMKCNLHSVDWSGWVSREAALTHLGFLADIVAEHSASHEHASACGNAECLVCDSVDR
jgi:hypothetical protein